MAKNWAIAIGINQYSFLPPLNYARQDAGKIQAFLETAGFEQTFLYTDAAAAAPGNLTLPSRANLLRMLRQLVHHPQLEAADNLWFFFSGHGIRHEDRDYLMPMDGDPEDVENTAIALPFITDSLRRCGTQNVVLILDACRQQNARSSSGRVGKQQTWRAKWGWSRSSPVAPMKSPMS